MNALLFERPVWFATGPLILEEEAQEMEDFSYHRPVLMQEAVELLAPRPGSLVVDATCGGGGHTEAILKTGADVLALDQDPDAIEQARERSLPIGGRVTLRQANFRDAGQSSRRTGNRRHRRRACSISAFPRGNWRMPERGFSMMRNGPLDMRMDPSHSSRPRPTSSTSIAKKSYRIISRSGRRTGRAADRQLDREDAQRRRRFAKRLRSRAPSKKWSAATGAGIRPPRLFRRCAWK